MKHKWILIAGALCALTLAGCTEEKEKLETKKPIETSTEKVNEEKEEVNEKVNEKKEEDFWVTKYDTTAWTETWEELKLSIEKVVVSDKAPYVEDDGTETTKSVIGIQFKAENLSDKKRYQTFPDMATLVTSTGEQIEFPASFLTDREFSGGDIYEGVTKTGDVIWLLERSTVEEVEWIKIIWDSYYEDPTGNGEKDLYKTHEVKLTFEK